MIVPVVKASQSEPQPCENIGFQCFHPQAHLSLCSATQTFLPRSLLATCGMGDTSIKMTLFALDACHPLALPLPNNCYFSFYSSFYCLSHSLVYLFLYVIKDMFPLSIIGFESQILLIYYSCLPLFIAGIK